MNDVWEDFGEAGLTDRSLAVNLAAGPPLMKDLTKLYKFFGVVTDCKSKGGK